MSECQLILHDAMIDDGQYYIIILTNTPATIISILSYITLSLSYIPGQ